MPRTNFSQALLLFLRAAIPAVLLVLVTGCGRGPTPLVSVKGKVLYQSLPVAGAVLVFAPDADRGGPGPLARAETQGDGSFVLHTGTATGAAPGWYRITVMALEQTFPGSVGGPAFTYPRSLLPDKYRDPELSGLNCEIKAGMDNTVNLNLE